jgi:hypothetical protein
VDLCKFLGDWRKTFLAGYEAFSFSFRHYVFYDMKHWLKIKLIQDVVRTRDSYPAEQFGQSEDLNMAHPVL